MHKKSFLFLCLAVIGVCSASTQPPAQTHKLNWVFKSYHCAFGCAPAFERELKTLQNSTLNFDETKSTFDLFNDCDGKTELHLKTQTSQQLLKALNQTLPPTQKLTPTNTQLIAKKFETGDAICVSPNNKSTRFWIVSMKNDEMIVYYEGATFLKFT
jgi:hypothetical protein